MGSVLPAPLPPPVREAHSKSIRSRGSQHFARFAPLSDLDSGGGWHLFTHPGHSERSDESL